MDTKYKSEKTTLFLSWLRSQFVGLTATGIDFFTTIFLTEIAGIWYAWSNATGASLGAMVSFLLCRSWAFRSKNKRWEFQAMRYSMTSGLALVMTTSGVWYLTESFGIPYVISKMMMSTLIGLTFNFLLFRYFVFK